MLVILFLSCQAAGPEEIALAACEATPGLGVDAVTYALSAHWLVEEERALWKDRPRSRGMEAIGTAGYGVIRANSSCRLEALEGDAATLVRTEPAVEPGDWTLRETRDLTTLERRMTLEVVEEAGAPRVALGLAAAQAEFEAADALIGSDPAAAAEALEALYARFPDPLLLWDIDEARGRQGARETLSWEVDGERLLISHEGPRKVDLEVTLRAGDQTVDLGFEEMVPGVELTRALPEGFGEAGDGEEGEEGDAPTLKIERLSVYR